MFRQGDEESRKETDLRSEAAAPSCTLRILLSQKAGLPCRVQGLWIPTQGTHNNTKVGDLENSIDVRSL